MSEFRAAVEAAVQTRDAEAIVASLADDVVFLSPAVFKPYQGKAIVSAILRHVVEVFDDFRYVRELQDDEGHALVFQATVEGYQVTGCDFLKLDADGKVSELMVMARPMKGLQALAGAMGARFEQIAAEAAEA